MVIADLKQKIGIRFGRNKTEELSRLLYEIAKRESSEPALILENVLSGENLSFEKTPFPKIKSLLLKKRYPNLTKPDLNRVYLAPLHLSEENGKQLEATYDGRNWKPSQVFIEKRARDFPLAGRIRSLWPDLPVREIESVDELRQPKNEWLAGFGKRTLAVTVEPFDLVKPCPCSSNTVSCNYYLLNIGYGCHFDCSYCYLQEYQNLPAILLPANISDFTTRMEAVLEKNPNQFTRIGTGEYADSLALDWLTEYSKTLVPFFADKSVTLELKTKSDCVENLIGLNHGGRTAIAWSVNPERFAKEEKGAAPILKRLEAAQICEKTGYGTAFHFDPIFEAENWEKSYKELVEQIFSHVHKSIRWFSLGMLRFHKDLRRVAEFRHPQSEIFLGEERLDPLDDKMRYAAETRIAIYRKMLAWIREHHPTVPVYLCMESPAVWKAVFEGKPYTGRIDTWISGCK